MQTKHNSEIESEVFRYAEIAQQWFYFYFHNQAAFEDRLRAGMRFGPKDPHEQQRIELTRSLGLFSYQTFTAMICGGEPYTPLMVSILWDRLVQAGLMLRSVPETPGSIPLATHQLDKRALYEHLEHQTFSNLFSPPSRLLKTYADAVVAIDVYKGGQAHRGSGFIVEERGNQYLLTCKHNIDSTEEIIIDQIATESGLRPRVGRFMTSDLYDIAVAKLTIPTRGPCFRLLNQIEVFDELFTLGYPRVPRAKPILLGHRGELNGMADLYVEKCPALIISNLVSPGSSGGPVLGRDGHCVGMTINWLEGQQFANGETERTRFAAALPAKLLQDAIAKHSTEAEISDAS